MKPTALLIFALLPALVNADGLSASLAGVQPNLALPLEKQAQSSNLQYAFDQAEAAPHKTVILPDGDVAFDLTPQRRFLLIDKSLRITSAGKTRLIMGPDNPTGPGWDHINYPWHGLHVSSSRSLTLTIDSNVELVGPEFDRDSQTTGLKAIPVALFIEGHVGDNVKRVIDWPNAKITGFGDGVGLTGDKLYSTAPDPVGCSTILRMPNAYIDVWGSGISAFGSDKELFLPNIWASAGWFYRKPDGGEGDAYGNTIYLHDANSIIISGVLETKYGRRCLKKAGVRSVGRSSHSIIGPIACRSGRVGQGTALEFDKFGDNCVSGLYADKSLYAAVQSFGGFTLTGGIIESQVFHTAAGTGDNNRPVIAVTGTKFVGCKSILQTPPGPNSYISFAHCQFIGTDDPSSVLFGLAGVNGPSSVLRVSNSLVRAKSCAIMFAVEVGDVKITDCDIEGVAALGIFGFGAQTGARTLIQGSTVVGAKFYHSALQADMDRVTFRD